MAKGITTSGFKFEVKDAVLDDMRLIELMSQSIKNPMVFPELIEKLLGAEQKEALYKHLESEDGRVPVKAIADAVTDIFNSFGETGKN